MMSDTEFKNLLEAAQKGDTKSLQSLIDMFMPTLYKNSYIDGMLNWDCLQELILKFIKNIYHFKFNSKIDILDLIYNE